MNKINKPKNEAVTDDKLLNEVEMSKSTENELRESEELFRSVFTTGAAGMVIISPTGKILQANPAFCHFIGYSEAELARLTIEEITHPESRDGTSVHYAEILTGQSQSLHYEKRYLRKDGQTVWGHVSVACAMNPERQPIYCIGMVQDITEPKHAEEALRKSEEKFSKVFHSTPDCLAITTLADGRFIEVNESFGRAFGYSREEIIGRTALELNIWDNPADRAGMIKVLQGSGNVRDFEVSFRDKAGKTLIGLYSAEFIEVKGEQYLLSLMSDITARKQAEEALRESEERFRHFYNDTPVMLHSIDRNGRLISVSNYWLAALGYDRSDVIGRQSTEFLTAASRRYAEEVALPEYFKTGFCKDVPYQIVTKTGEIIDVLLSATAERNDSGEIVRSLAVMTDVTERKHIEEALRESEEKFSKAFRATPTALAISTMSDGRYIEVNEAFVQTLGYRHEEIIGHTSLELNLWENPQDRDRYVQLLWEKGEACDLDVRFRAKSGETVVGLVSGEVIVLNGEKCLLSLVNDITGRKRVEEEVEVLNTNLAARAAELEIANEELEAYGYTVSHDLRKPLTAISGYSQVILELYGKNLDEQCKGYLQEILNGTVRMNHFIDTLLNFSRKTRGEVRRETVDLGEMAKAVIAELKRADPLRHVSCTIAEGMVANGDAKLLQVVLDNLLGNAWKYTANNAEALIECGVSECRGKPAYFVRDNGAGFDMASADRLFSPFQRLHAAEEFEGTGIGLATVQRIVQRHGGQVWAEGEIGKGATFYFTLG